MSEIDWSKAPEGATHYAPKREENCMYRAVFWRIVGNIGVEAWSINDDGSLQHHGSPAWIASDLSRLIPRPVAPAWSGDGLPPVGIECEDDAGNQVLIVAHHINGTHAIFAESLTDGLLYYGSAGEFRPIRTPEQIAADERAAEIRAMGRVIAADEERRRVCCATCARAAVEAIYDAGYRKAKGGDA